MVNGCGYTVSQFGPVVLSTGQRKHQNLLLDDYSKENERTYGCRYPPTGYSLTLSRRQPAATLHEQGTASDAGPNGNTQKVTWDSSTHNNEQSSKALALQVRNRRTPSGQFFSTINSTLFEKQPPPNYYEPDNVTDAAISTLRGGSLPSPGSSGRQAHMSDTARSHEGSGPAAGGDDSPAVYQFSATSQPGTLHASTLGGGTRRSASWLMPWQTGDRAMGRKMADMIRKKRTPSGSFALLDLAKPNK
mmetsp:Transcript_9225/g.19738  ORF Transcript_9225/g.19738 Transcript_9225/m.19738 type:complete len:247 (-) Transcript_9225:1017-1757(-)|eukprot:CAMPEP_0202890310 /NCGR_PEP_ID=MMETSP1392-20130828/766_1 /ASSEMBLY_ACC=CAM_ASM_000868 /TAXON_ID=225041 /ORGANISM="Chlamydomonas chlamydogama, Strain SAG 11-48b" /LENGTH=246 /DNA_ID=CAMNT_0049573859 /DNA_START=150 /DNA_END=890 /DNA_ORIENTATION=+